MTQTQTALEMPRMDSPGAFSNIRAERPNLLPPFSSSLGHHTMASTYPGDMDSQASRSLRIQLMLNPQRKDGIPTPSPEDLSYSGTKSTSTPADGMPAMTLPPLATLPNYRSDGPDSTESPTHVLSSALIIAGEPRAHGRPSVTTPKDSRKGSDYFSPMEMSSRHYSDGTMTPPSQIRHSPTMSTSQPTSSPARYQHHSPYSDHHMHSELKHSSITDQTLAHAPGSTAQSSYRMMAVDIDNQTVAVPVDVQAASKMADDRRRRNAGASARFRQRRKEKERDTQSTIENLRTKLRKAEEELRELQMEREYLRLQRDQYFYMLNNRPIYAA